MRSYRLSEKKPDVWFAAGDELPYASAPYSPPTSPVVQPSTPKPPCEYCDACGRTHFFPRRLLDNNRWLAVLYPAVTLYLLFVYILNWTFPNLVVTELGVLAAIKRFGPNAAKTRNRVLVGIAQALFLCLFLAGVVMSGATATGAVRVFHGAHGQAIECSFVLGLLGVMGVQTILFGLWLRREKIKVDEAEGSHSRSVSVGSGSSVELGFEPAPSPLAEPPVIELADPECIKVVAVREDEVMRQKEVWRRKAALEAAALRRPLVC
ncbi:uncharacterized protein LOC62_03G004539 [Vanrija pseudolonga]|uniref:Uncharacterized protein n=1 Tax=Vanrija pseudolonga TaxID=143232 RepID=A0AAF1BHE8_9TREE|nr:hypothetical protein LOC62_03G004539 [Vanrija pseudolonga]